MRNKLIKFVVVVIVAAASIFFGFSIPEGFVQKALCDYAGFCAEDIK